ADRAAAAATARTPATTRLRRRWRRSRTATWSQSRSRKSGAAGGATSSCRSGIEDLAQRASCVMEPRRDRPSRHAEAGRRGGVVETDQIDEQDDGAGRRRKPGERARDDEGRVLLVFAREQLEHADDLAPALAAAKLVP